MKTKRTLWFTLFILCSLALVYGSSGAFAGETGSETGPAALAATTKPLAGPTAPGLPQTDVQVNWSESDVVSYTTQSETSIRVNPNTGTICVAYNDSPSGTGFSRSTDGGATFVDNGSFPTGTLPITYTNQPAVAAADPSLEWRHKDGLFYYTAIWDGFPLSLWRSTDDCETFSYHHHITETGAADREIMVIDNNPDSDFYGRFYVTFGPGVQVTYSDDGTTWAESAQVDPGGKVFAPWPALDPISGTVYIAWRRWHTDYTGLMDIEVARSTDGGAEWDLVANPVTFATNPYDEVASLRCDSVALFGDIKHFTAPQIVVDNNRNLHIVYSRDPDSAGVGDRINVYYRRSTTQGVTWEPEVQLNDDATLTDQWFPTVSVGPTGIVVAAWYDRRNDPSRNYMYDYYMAISRDNGVTWEPNVRVSDVSSNVATTNPNFDKGITKKCYHGDYDQQVQQGGYVYMVWSDDRNVQHGHYDPDIWFDKVLLTPEVVYLPLISRSAQ